MSAVQSIILKKQDRGEADEVVKFLSRDLGWLTGVAKNSRRSRVRFGGHLEPFSLVDLTVRPRKKDDMVWIEESQVIRSFGRLRSDIGRVARAAYFLEVASLFVPEASPDEALFDFLLNFLEALDRGELGAVPLVLAEIKLLSLLGYEPRFDVCLVCGKTLTAGQDAVFSGRLGGTCHPSCVESIERKTMILLSPDTLAVTRRGLELGPNTAARLRLSRKGVEELWAALRGFVRYLRGEDIRSLQFLEMMNIG